MDARTRDLPMADAPRVLRAVPKVSRSGGVYRFLEPGHPLHAFMAERSGEIDRAFEAAGPGLEFVGTDLKVARDEQGFWRPKRLVRQFMDQAGGGIWIWSRKTGGSALYRFPDDPYLPGLADWWRDPRDEAGHRLFDLKVLRYVPTRRVTISGRRSPAAGSERIIVKFKRRSKIDHAAEMLERVHAAAAGQDTSLRIAHSLGECATSSAFFQSFLEGVCFDAALTDATLTHCMERAGAIHARLHALDVPGVPQWKLASYIKTIQDDIAWVSFMRPEWAELLGSLWPDLQRRLAAADGARHVFCHGDFVPGQLLCEPNTTAVTDFDMARRGIDLQEIGKWLASLKYHVPLFAETLEADAAHGRTLIEAAQEAYLQAYSRETGRVISRRYLAPFIAAAEIHYLGIWLKKDRFAPSAFALALQTIKGCV